MREPKLGERVVWEPLTPGSPIQYGSISFISPSIVGGYRVAVNWDVADGEGRHETMHHLTATSHVKFVEKEPSNV